jgi:hypothetical protein
MGRSRMTEAALMPSRKKLDSSRSASSSCAVRKRFARQSAAKQAENERVCGALTHREGCNTKDADAGTESDSGNHMDTVTAIATDANISIDHSFCAAP